jgi:aerotaxis receptor
MSTPKPVYEEYEIDLDGALVSQTDLDGNILYANKNFREVSGYTLDELVGQPHSIVRHPDMPRGTFIKMWDTIKSGQVFNGIIKNMRKDGKYYWINLEILPIKEEDGSISNYMSVARAPSRKDIEENEEIYRRILAEELRKEGEG